MRAHRDEFISNSVHGRQAKKAHKSHLIFPDEANQKRRLKCSWKLMPFYSCYICYSLPILVIHSEHGNKQEMKNPGILQVTKSSNHIKCMTEGDKALCCFTNFLKDLQYSDFKHVKNHSRREILGLNCSKYHCAAVSVNWITTSLGEGALQTTYYSHIWIY